MISVILATTHFKSCDCGQFAIMPGGYFMAGKSSDVSTVFLDRAY
jgi:hypothetical protein